MTILRGKGLGLELALDGCGFDEGLAELEGRLSDRPGFYRGAALVASLGAHRPTLEQLARLEAVLSAGSVRLTGISGGEALEAWARERGIDFQPTPSDAAAAELEERRAEQDRRDVELSDSARSLVADFAGARADIAQRRKRGEPSVRRLEPRAPAAPPPMLSLVEPAPATLYHVGTLRGGQALHQIGNIVVVGDVNPGAELVATGDIAVFGRLAGVAHAGAQGDEKARIFALALDATQLRIATCIAADPGTRAGTPRPEAASVEEGRIVIASLDRLEHAAEGEKAR